MNAQYSKRTKPTPESGKSSAPPNRFNGRSLLIQLLVLMLAACIAVAGSQGGTHTLGIPVFAMIIIWIFAVQYIAFIPAWRFQTEKFFDLTGSLTYISAIAAALLLSGNTDPTALLVTTAVTAWALRLGSFLFIRVSRAGTDDRFDQIKPDFMRFLNVWVLQGLWVTITLSAALAAVTAVPRPSFGIVTVVGLLMWAAGFAFEVAADMQKNRFRSKPVNRGEFIHTGLWSWSRHPNYFGEILLWIGIAVMALPALHGWQYVTLISPVFVFILLSRISGVPLLERKADERWGDRPDYQQYRSSTSALIPLPPRK